MTIPARDPHFLRLTMTSLSGPLIWALHFGAVYGGQHVACERQLLAGGLTRTAIIIVTVVAAAAIGAVWASARRFLTPDQQLQADLPAFLHLVTLFLLGLSLFGVIAAGLAGVMLPACPALR